MKVLMASPDRQTLEDLFHHWQAHCLNFVVRCLEMDPASRPSCTTLLHHKLFTHDGFPQAFYPHLRKLVETEFLGNPLLQQTKRRSALLPHSSTRDSSNNKRHDGFYSPVAGKSNSRQHDDSQAWYLQKPR
jgi:serine/threonine protein kinase